MGGGGVIGQIPSVGRVSIFSGTTQCNICSTLTKTFPLNIGQYNSKTLTGTLSMCSSVKVQVGGIVNTFFTFMC